MTKELELLTGMGLVDMLKLANKRDGVDFQELDLANMYKMIDAEVQVEEKRPSKFPLTNIGITPEDVMIVQIAIPGMTKENIELTIQGDMLRIQGTPTVCPVGQSINFDMQDIVIKHFTREIELHEDFVAGEISADVANGVLTVKIEKYIEPTYIVEIA